MTSYLTFQPNPLTRGANATVYYQVHGSVTNSAVQVDFNDGNGPEVVYTEGSDAVLNFGPNWTWYNQSLGVMQRTKPWGPVTTTTVTVYRNSTYGLPTSYFFVDETDTLTVTADKTISQQLGRATQAASGFMAPEGQAAQTLGLVSQQISATQPKTVGISRMSLFGIKQRTTAKVVPKATGSVASVLRRLYMLGNGALPIAPVGFFFVDHPTLLVGQGTYLRWFITGATSITNDAPNQTYLGGAQYGYAYVSPSTTTTYTITATGPGGTTTFTVTVTVVNPQLKPTVKISATATTIKEGDSFTLNWSTANASTVQVSNTNGPWGLSEGRVLSPTKTTTYVISATGTYGVAQAAVTVNVNAAPSMTSYWRKVANNWTLAYLTQAAWLRTTGLMGFDGVNHYPTGTITVPNGVQTFDILLFDSNGTQYTKTMTVPQG